MTVRQLYERLNGRIPPSLSCEWDNDGLMCCPDGSKEVKKVLIALDATGRTVEKAIKDGFDVVLTHHPFVFKGLKAVDDENPVAAKAIELIRTGISVMSFHTRLDAVEGGVNDTLASLLGVKVDGDLYDGNIAVGRIGELEEEMTLRDFSDKVKKALKSPAILCSDAGLTVKRVALVGGNGGSFIAEARKAGADTYLSGRLDYHSMTDAPDFGFAPMNMIEAGHFYTENPVCNTLYRMVKETDESIECEIFDSNNIKAV